MERFFRDTAPPPQRPLTEAQKRALSGLAGLCPEMGEEASAAEVAGASELQRGAATLALRGLERRGLVTGHGEDSDPRVWAPTLTGRAHAAHLTAQRARDAADDRAG